MNRMAIAASSLLLAWPIGLEAQRPAESDRLWPPPPEPARIQYVGMLYSDMDLGQKTSFFGKLKKGLLGGGEAATSVHRPHDVHVDREGRMFVTNGIQQGFWVFDPVAKTGELVVPEGEASLGKPMGLAGDAAGLIYVADARGRRVVAMDPSGSFIRAYGGSQLLLNPVDVAVSPDGTRIYVADSYLHQVVIFDSEGELVGRLGKHEGDLAAKDGPTREGTHGSSTPGHSTWDNEPSDLVENRGTGSGEFRYPAFLAVGPEGTLYVSDGLNFRVQAFSPEGEFVRAWGRLGDTPGSFARPKGIGVDSGGHVYVVDAAFNNVQVFDPLGRLLLSFSGFGRGEGELWLPGGITVDGQDRIFVADRYNNRLQVFRFLGVDDDARVAGARDVGAPDGR